jgi:hypothetical protein
MQKETKERIWPIIRQIFSKENLLTNIKQFSGFKSLQSAVPQNSAKLGDPKKSKTRSCNMYFLEKRLKRAERERDA